MVQGSKAGKISKPYGLHGEVQLILNPLAEHYIRTGNPLFVQMDGQGVPFFMEEVERVSAEQAIVKLEFVNSVEEAREICGCEVYTDPKFELEVVQAGDDPSRVLGYLATDKVIGELGPISEYYPHPVNPQWGITYQGREILVPANPDLVLKIQDKKKQILLDLPEGLTEV